MGPVRELIEKFRHSDGRVRMGMVSAISAVAAAIALLVGVLPVVASNNAVHSTLGIHPVVVSYGGGSGACSATLGGRLPSAAGNEFHVNNPMPGATYTSSDGVITVTVGANQTFGFSVNAASGKVVYDVIVNGGPKNNHYDYDDHPDFDGVPAPGVATADGNLHAPAKGNGYHNLSHINVCYDVPGVTVFVCNLAVTLTDPTGLFTVASARIFANDTIDCRTKRASYVLDNSAAGPVTLTFAGDGSDTAAGRLDLRKDFNNQVGGFTAFADLQYRPDTLGAFVDVPWCKVDTKDTNPNDGDGIDGNEFDHELGAALYPQLPAGHIACKVFVGETATGVQNNVIYFEFVDPQFR